MLKDEALKLQPLVTKTATFQGDAFSLKGGTPKSSAVLYAEILCKTGSSTGGTGTVVFSIEHSTDGATNWTTLTGGADQTITLPATAGSCGIVNLPISTDKQWIRLVATITGTAPTITYSAWIGLTKP